MPNASRLMPLKVYTDGACSGNPGPSSVGISLQDSLGNVICEVSETIGYATNNVAEYMACIIGLIEAIKIGCSVQRAACREQTGKIKRLPAPCSLPPVILHSDSELMIRQLQGVYSVKSADLLPLHTTAKKLFSLFTHVELKSIPREENSRADFLAKQALKQNHKAAQDRRPKTKNQSEIACLPSRRDRQANLKQQGVLL